MISMSLDCRQREHHVKIWARLRESERNVDVVNFHNVQNLRV